MTILFDYEITESPTLDELLALFDDYHRQSEEMYKGDGVWADGAVRNTSRRVLGYVDADYDSPRIVAGLERLCKYEYDGFYDGGLAAAALARGSVHTKIRKYIHPAIAFCNQMRDKPASNSPNMDGFAAFGMMETARAVDKEIDVSYLLAARRMMWVNILDQLPNGTWALKKDQQIWYHSIVTRGLISLLSILPKTFFHHNKKSGQADKFRPATLLAVNHIVSRMKSDGTFEIDIGSPVNRWDPSSTVTLAMAYTELDLPIFDAVRLAAKGTKTVSVHPDDNYFQRRGSYIMALGSLIKAYRKAELRTPNSELEAKP